MLMDYENQILACIAISNATIIPIVLIPCEF
jgi:hypothetical protein